MNTHQNAAGEFKAKCLKLLDEVSATGQALTITKRGRPVARLMPMPGIAPLLGAMKGMVLQQQDIVAPLDLTWEADA